jgi:hypothetical protein
MGIYSFVFCVPGCLHVHWSLCDYHVKVTAWNLDSCHARLPNTMHDPNYMFLSYFIYNVIATRYFVMCTRICRKWLYSKCDLCTMIYYNCFCDQTIFKSVTKRCYICYQSDGKSVTILNQTVTMPNTILWRFKHDIYDDSKMMISAATSLMTSPPRHLSAWHTAGYDQHKTTFVTKPDCHTTIMSPSVSQVDWRLWRKRIVTKSLTALTATLVSQAGVKLWRKQGIIYDQKRSSQNEFKSMKTQNLSQIGDTSVTKKPISSPMNKCDATIVTKTKSSQNRHKRLFVTILESSMTLM